MKLTRFKFWLGVLSGVGGALNFSAYAVDAFTISNVDAITNTVAEDLVKTVGFGARHHPYQSASPLGLAIGLDLGIDVTVISIPQSFIDALSLVGNSTKVSSSIPLPRLNLRKGLPFGIDFGFSYIGAGGYSVTGGDLQWTFLNKPFPPKVAIRLGYTSSKLGFINTNSLSFECVVSKKITYFFDPYVGLGFVRAAGSLSLPAGSVLPVGVSADPSIGTGSFFVGLPISLALFKITADYSTTFNGISTIGGKFSFVL